MVGWTAPQQASACSGSCRLACPRPQKGADMARILAVTWDGGGNVPPMLGIAGELQRRGHQVRVLGHPQQREAVVSAGLKFVDYHHGRGWSPKVARFPLRFIFGVFTAPGLGKDVRDEINREPVDLALVDSMILSCLHA